MIDLEKLTEEQREGFYELQRDLEEQVVKEFSKPLPEEARNRLNNSIGNLYEEYRKAGFLIAEENPEFELEVNETEDELVYNITFIPKNNAAAQVMKVYNNVQK